MRTTTTSKRVSPAVAALAIVVMGGMTVACSRQGDKPAETSTPSSQISPTEKQISPTEKNVRTNVTRPPMSVAPNGSGAGGGNASVPCGFGPAGGGPCTRDN